MGNHGCYQRILTGNRYYPRCHWCKHSSRSRSHGCWCCRFGGYGNGELERNVGTVGEGTYPRYRGAGWLPVGYRCFPCIFGCQCTARCWSHGGWCGGSRYCGCNQLEVPQRRPVERSVHSHGNRERCVAGYGCIVRLYWCRCSSWYRIDGGWCCRHGYSNRS